MATGLDIGVAAVTILQASCQLVRFYERSYRSFKGASKEVRRLHTSVSHFIGVLHYFSKTAKDLHQRNLGICRDTNARKLLFDIRNQIQEEVTSIKEAFRRLKPLHDPKCSSISRLRAKIMWMLLDEHDLKELLARLDTMILSISVLQGTFNLNINMAIWDQLKASGQQIDPASRQEM